ncbi:hypothetical protein [Nitrincola iocasae]|uniref:Motility protein n=1 Tax=Nitrincola iocasae TaxID=2614693 RepID=A0A5J6LEJ0_9GAMM|nr:hypothetical protein [Nitrincola iocasae]QEW06726.1 hypothetical protein F5I99_09535 [Nitrincola iocasae]
MNIAATATALSALSVHTEHAVKMNKIVTDQIEAQGEMILSLIPGNPSGVKADPTSAVGQIIDVQV